VVVFKCRLLWCAFTLGISNVRIRTPLACWGVSYCEKPRMLLSAAPNNSLQRASNQRVCYQRIVRAADARRNIALALSTVTESTKQDARVPNLRSQFQMVENV
jgi:hypothetical protein